jgi:hypothetical protein
VLLLGLLFGFIRLPAKLSKYVKIANTRNQVKPKPEAFSAVAVTVGHDFETFDETDNMFVRYTFT